MAFKRILPEHLTPIGYIARSHGFEGEAVLALYSPVAKNFSAEYLFISLNGKVVPYFVEMISALESSALVKFEDISTEAEAKELSGSEVSIGQENEKQQASVLTGMNQYTGFLMIDESLGEIGRIIKIISLPGQTLFSVERNKEEILVPASKPIFLKADKQKKIVHVSLPDGLLDIN